ncbi:DEAD/DEAH box helicase [Sediminibacterium soli]|uniref:DEAD/DEAH box helicase n=1 Tax=Sediminibacterium soli TaxID=2698829 RepID=UPI0013799824|nr:DEAD/DEAH box helicase family protein [Sediminibacterium soli]NCI45078.1 DEAD/DEAH box helicase family protein [Sediminibacterium soli]
MELKSYQQRVIKDLASYLSYLDKYLSTAQAFNTYWEDRIGPYNPVSGQGMQPYKNTIPNAAHICIKVPTAGGKTFIACHALQTIFGHFPISAARLVVWLVPWSNLLDQTVNNLRNPDHPYRQKLNSLFRHRVEVYEKKDLLQGANFNPTVVKDQLSIVVMSFASLRARNKEDRKTYQQNSQLSSFTARYTSDTPLLEDADETSLVNVIRSLQPVLVVDESHNAESDLSVDMMKSLNPSFILDLTATPRDNSNIISLVPAIELKKEHMVKLPVIVYNHHDKTDVINSALHLQRRLEQAAVEQEKNGGRYIRPIVLFQAQSRTSEDNTTFEKIKEQLLKIGIPGEQIRIKTAEKDELKGVDLLSKDCPVRYIITINALKEGWDCPFAYVLASLADRSSAVEVEQLLGRVLRQPYVSRHSETLLNVSYVLTASARFNETLQNIVRGLQASGFSENDYRQCDTMQEEEKKQVVQKPLDRFLFPEQKNTLAEPDIDIGRISYQPANGGAVNDQVVSEIAGMAEQQEKEFEKVVGANNPDENFFQEMPNKVPHYRISEANRLLAADILLPKFYLETPKNDIFGTGKVLLNQESLLKDFRLGNEDTKIDFEQAASDLFKVDIEQTGVNEYTPKYTKIADPDNRNPIIDYILAQPKEGQVKNIAHLVMQSIGSLYPIADQEISTYVARIVQNQSPEILRDMIVQPANYASKIRFKIRELADRYAELRFNDTLKLRKILAAPEWKFPETLVPGRLGPAIGKSLYEQEADMNHFEAAVIADISSLPNIAFWHRNLSRGKGFAINGFKSNHYPDFIIVTTSGNIIVLETKGDDRDNSDSAAKCRLGNTWAETAGTRFYYFMVFDTRQVEGAFKVDKAKELIRQL